MMQTKPALLTLTEAVDGLNAKEFTAVELLVSTLTRLHASEPQLHAYVENYAEDALQHAMVADRRRARGTTIPPLLGVPIAVKDIFDIAGKKTLCGSAIRQDVDVAARDSGAVHQLRRAGALLVGKTTTQEFAAGVISAPCRNPWNPEHIPGGSSGGSAAAVSVGSAVGAIGSDTGGSIRIPASVTGTVGLKPTYGRLSLTGVYPLSPSLDTPGPITLSVADAAVMFHVMDGDIKSVPTTLQTLREREGSLSGVRIGVLGGYFLEVLDDAVQEAFERSVSVFEELGAELVECTWADAEIARSAAMLINRTESAAVHHEHLRTRPDLLGDDVRTRLEAASLMSAGPYFKALQARERAKQSVAKLYADHQLDAVIAPTLKVTAPKAGAMQVTYRDGSTENIHAALTRLTMPWNATGQPVISLPCGFDDGSLPVGLSIVGRPHAESDILRIAHAFEQATPWHLQAPSMVERPADDDEDAQE